MLWLWIVLAVVLVGLFLAVMWRIGARAGSPAEARRRFVAQRDALPEAFFQAASASGKPRGLRWKSIDWQPGGELVREKETRQLAALVGVTVAFEAIPGSDMEDLPAVGNLRHGSAVFFYHRGAWHTTGRPSSTCCPPRRSGAWRRSMSGWTISPKRRKISQRIVRDGDTQRRDFLQPPPTARHPGLLAATYSASSACLSKNPSHDTGGNAGSTMYWARSGCSGCGVRDGGQHLAGTSPRT